MLTDRNETDKDAIDDADRGLEILEEVDTLSITNSREEWILHL